MSTSDRHTQSPLTTPKPLDCYEWLALEDETQAFFISLCQRMVEEISDQISVPEGLVEYYLREEGVGLAWENHGNDDGWEYSDFEAVRQKLETTCITLSGIHFPHVDSEHRWNYEQLVEPIKHLHFEECHFYGNRLLWNTWDMASRYSRCVFYNDWQVSETEAFWGTEVLFDHCEFRREVLLAGHGPDVVFLEKLGAIFQNCSLQELRLESLRLEADLFRNSMEIPFQINALATNDCVLAGKLTIDNIKSMDHLRLTSTQFENKFAMINCECDTLTIKNTNFDGLADFYQSQFENVRIQKSIFRDFAGFEGCCFGKTPTHLARIVLRYVTFYSFINFRSAIFNQALDLRNTNRQQQPNFLDAKFSKMAAKGTDRETFRIIKHSFDAVGNHIEANKYFAYEMQAYRRELGSDARQGGRKNRRERILLALNGFVSNHGQDYLRAFSLLALAVAINAVVLANHEYQWFVLPESLQAPLWKLAALGNGLANGFLPLRALLGDDLAPLALWVLFAAVVISTLTWHLLVAARRHGRR